MTNDIMWALQVGTLVGMLTSIFDEALEGLVVVAKHIIYQQPWGNDMLSSMGFETGKSPFNQPRLTKKSKEPRTPIPRRGSFLGCDAFEFELRKKDGSYETDKEGAARPRGVRPGDVALLQTVVFGYAEIRLLDTVLNTAKEWNRSTAEYPRLAISIVSIGIACFVAGEIFTNWQPTRRLGWIIQSRWTRIAHNWTHHFWRSLTELVMWWTATGIIYHLTNGNFWMAVQIGLVIACMVSICASYYWPRHKQLSCHSSANDNHEERFTTWIDETASSPSFMSTATTFIEGKNALRSRVYGKSN